MPTPLPAATLLSEQGCRWFPIVGKSPLAKFSDDAEVDLLPKGGNEGVRMGKGVVGLDFDSLDALKEVAERFGLPSTLTARTGRGFHCYYLGEGIRGGTKILGIKGFDIRAWPNQYLRWPNGFDPKWIEPVEMPVALPQGLADTLPKRCGGGARQMLGVSPSTPMPPILRAVASTINRRLGTENLPPLVWDGAALQGWCPCCFQEGTKEPNKLLPNRFVLRFIWQSHGYLLLVANCNQCGKDAWDWLCSNIRNGCNRDGQLYFQWRFRCLKKPVWAMEDVRDA